MKKNKLTLFDALINNFFILKLVNNVSRIRIPFAIILQVVDKTWDVYMNVFFIRYIVKGIYENYDVIYLIILVVIASILFLTRRLLFAVYEYSVKTESDQLIYKKLNNLIYKKAVDIELAAFENSEFYDSYSKALLETDTRPTAIVDNFVNFFTTFFAVITMTISLIKIDPIALLFILLPLVFSPILGTIKSRLKYSLDMDNIKSDRSKKYINRLIYLKSYTYDLRTTNIFNVLKNNFLHASDELIKNRKKYGMRIALFSFLIELCNLILPFFLSSFYSLYKILIKKTMSIDIYSVLSVVVVSLAGNIKQATNSFVQILADGMYAKNIKDFLSYKSNISESQDGINTTDFKSIEIKDVSFAYRSSLPNVLENISLKIEKGEKIAIVGYNGAGKSSLIKILLRLYDPSQGTVFFNGVDVKKYNLKSYRKLFGTVMQDFKIFSLSVSDNIAPYEKDISKIKDAAFKSNILDKIMSFPKGFASILTREFDENGVLLSGGEQQKIAIARALSSNFQIAILDEPSSALDPVTEEKVVKNLISVGADKTVIMISHRLSTASKMDKIYFMENGKIIEYGTHDELMQIKGKYARMYEIQSNAYKKGALNGEFNI